jgi:peptidoglycan/LPS O-acetylase OafA/YrhL
VPSPEVELLWNPANWSIPCELFFYLCFPVFLVWLNKRGMTRRGLIATAAMIYAIQSLVFVSIAATIARYWTPTNILGRFTATRYLATDLFVYRSPLMRFGEFAVGVIVGLLFLGESGRNSGGTRHSWKRTAGILLCLFGIVFVASVEVPPAWTHAVSWLRAFTLFTPLYAMLILLLARGGTPFARLLSWRPIELLGESSYSLYLIHTPILTIVLYKLRSGQPLSGMEIAASLAVTLIASIVCFKLIETPSRKKWRALALKWSRKPILNASLIA